ncbi:MAG: FAD-binding oxidoreductase [Citricoccus sp.]
METQITREVAPSVWHGWGDPGHARPLGTSALAFLKSGLGVPDVEPRHGPVGLDQVQLSPSTLTESGPGAEALAALRRACGAEHVSTERMARILHAGGKSTPDLLRRRGGDALDAPDAVVFPDGDEEVRAVLAACAQHRLAVTPFGGGTSVVGGVEPHREGFTGAVTLDLGRMDRLLSLDPVSRTATFEAGIRGPALEAALAQHGFTLGHLPQSHQQATLGGYLATRSAGQASTGYGRSDELVSSVHLETPAGPWDAGRDAPGTAAGPDLLHLAVGSEGVLGVITSATMRIAPVAEHHAHGAWSFPSFAAGVEALRLLRHEGHPGDLPQVCRLSDADETFSTLRQGGWKTSALASYLRTRGQQTPALALFVWEGSAEDTRRSRRRSTRILQSAGGVPVGPLPAKAWEHGRFSGPYLRDELLTRGIYAETLETATTWARMDQTYRQVREAIHGAVRDGGGTPFVLTHVSHVYPDGASLYFTTLAGLEQDPLAQNARIKSAASRAIMDAGATITHHHAIGRDHAPYLQEEIGTLGIQVLRSVKDTLDPVGIMNPGALIPAPSANANAHVHTTEDNA